jgi:hypothetical protein
MFHFASVRTTDESVDGDRRTWPALSFSGMNSSSMRIEADNGAGGGSKEHATRTFEACGNHVSPSRRSDRARAHEHRLYDKRLVRHLLMNLVQWTAVCVAGL